MGAWIEIATIIQANKQYTVAPLVGAWIEIADPYEDEDETKSLPSWERGLKLFYNLID